MRRWLIGVWISALAGWAGMVAAEVIIIYDGIDGCLVDKSPFGDYEGLYVFPTCIQIKGRGISGSTAQESRGAFEFDLRAIPAASTIDRALLTIHCISGSVLEAPQEFYGYAGNGSIEKSDFFEQEYYLGNPKNVTIYRYDITSFIQDVFADGQSYAGITGKQTARDINANYLARAYALAKNDLTAGIDRQENIFGLGILVVVEKI
jgi:hypothetical protein